MTSKQGYYLYAIATMRKEKQFGPIGINGEDNEVFSVCHEDIGAVLSASPIKEYPITRAYTLVHQKVMETVMADYPMLPVRFGTIAEGLESIRQKVLKDRYNELKGLLEYHRDKVELGLKALWLQMEPVFGEIIEEDREIMRLKDRLKSRRGGSQRDQIRLGEMVKKALETKKGREEKRIMNALQGIYVECRSNRVFGDQMITNSAFLVKKDQEKAFDDAVDTLGDQYDGRIKLKYVGPIPPCNFVEIVVKW